MALDAIAVLDHLQITKVAVVGWSDGAITGLNLAMNFTSRVERVFAHGANVQANQSIPGRDDPIVTSDSGSLDADFATNGTTYSTSERLARRATNSPYAYTCQALSPLPDRCDAMVQAVQKSVQAPSKHSIRRKLTVPACLRMWASEPTWGPEALAKIKCPVWSVDGDHDVAVERNQADTIAAWIPFAGQLVLPQVGHDALLQDPTFFNFAMGYFLDMGYDGVLPYY